MDHTENAFPLMFRSCPLQRERVYRAVAQKRPLFGSLSRGRCVATAVDNTFYLNDNVIDDYCFLWRIAKLYILIDIYQRFVKPADSVLYPEDGGSRFYRNVGTFETTWRHIAEDCTVTPSRTWNSRDKEAEYRRWWTEHAQRMAWYYVYLSILLH
jgi:hypothetical protein